MSLRATRHGKGERPASVHTPKRKRKSTRKERALKQGTHRSKYAEQ